MSAGLRLALCLALSPAAALAQQPAAGGAAARGESRGLTLPVVPTVKFSASTDADAVAKASLSVQRGALDDHLHVDLAPELEVSSSSGLASLFSFENSRARANQKWSIGATLTLSWWGLAPFSPHEKQFLEAAFKRCVDACDRSGEAAAPKKDSEDDVAKFCGAYRGVTSVPADFDARLLCDEGKKELTRAVGTSRPPVSGSVPTLFLSVGGTASGQTFKYQEADAALNLTEQRSTKFGGSAGASLAYLKPMLKGDAATFELGIRYDSKWSASDTAVKWCTPAGSVARDTGTGSDPAESCSEGVLGGPSRQQRLFATLRGGLMDIHLDKNDHNTSKSVWRFAAGPYLDYRWSDSTSTLRLGAQVPLYFNLLDVAGYGEKNFQGVVRLTPAIAAERTPAGWGPFVMVTVDVIADRFMLHRALDW